MRHTVLAVLLLLVPASAEASGFHIDEQDARATGRAGAITASPTNASTIHYNPAGLAAIAGLHVDAGMSFVGPSAKFHGGTLGDVTAEDQVFTLPQGYASYRIDRTWGIGVGFNAPFGLSLRWPETSPGRTNTREADLRTFFITPAVGVNLSSVVPGLSFGAGLDLVPASVKLTRDILFGSEAGSVALGGRAFGAGARAGLLYRPKGLEQWSFGVTYRSPVKITFDGTADFDAGPVFRASLPPDGDAKTSIVLPQTLDFGVAFSPVPEWQVEVDLDWLGWSSYDSIVIHLPANQTSIAPKDWHDSIALRVGTEYTVDKRWSGRLGFVFDQTPVPGTTLDFQLPDANRYCLTVGLGATLTDAIQADVGFLYILPVSRATSYVDAYQPSIKGTFDVSAWVLGLSVGVAFGGTPSEVPPSSTAAAPAEPAPM